MPRRSRQAEPVKLRNALIKLLAEFDKELESNELRAQVLSLVPAFHTLRDLGSSLIAEDVGAARERILYYLKHYHGVRIRGDELMVVSGIGEWARRVRELRVELGWPILTGVSINEMAAQELEAVGDLAYMAPDEYVLVNTEPDREAAYRWNVARKIRSGKGSVRDRILEFLKLNVGTAVTGEELRYVAKDKTEWARRVRELRTEFGWPVVTRQHGLDLKVGEYLLEADRQNHKHDRVIPDDVRRAVLVRDQFRCRNLECGWAKRDALPEDFRILELHHIEMHADGGANTRDNLLTLCNSCHDAVHANRLNISDVLNA